MLLQHSAEDRVPDPPPPTKRLQGRCNFCTFFMGACKTKAAALKFLPDSLPTFWSLSLDLLDCLLFPPCFFPFSRSRVSDRLESAPLRTVAARLRWKSNALICSQISDVPDEGTAPARRAVSLISVPDRLPVLGNKADKPTRQLEK